jgi:hypothetical protein
MRHEALGAFPKEFRSKLLKATEHNMLHFSAQLQPAHFKGLLCTPHGKHRLPLLWMHVYLCVAWQQTSYISVLLLGADRIENTVSLLLRFVYRAVA